MEQNEYLDFDEAVQLLKTTPSTLYKWLQAGKIPGHKLGRQWRFLRDELEIHVSGKGSRIHVQKDFLNLAEILASRSTTKEGEVNTQSVSERIIWDTFEHGSRRVHVYPTKGKYEISYRIKSGLEKLAMIQEESFHELDASLAKNSTELDDSSTRRLYLHRGDGEVLQVRYQKLETVTGPRLTLTIWQPEKDVVAIERLGGSKQDQENFKAWLDHSKGLILVSGATGSGKTTTIYAIINELKNRGRLVFTIEDHVDMVVEGINQIEVREKLREEFDQIFDKVYSSDPDVICLGLSSYIGMEEKIFNAAYRAASTGHVVIVQLDQPSCDEALSFYKKHVQYPIDPHLIGVSCQKLVEENGRVKPVYEFLNGAS